MNANLRALCTRTHKQHGSARRPPSTRRARCCQQGRPRLEGERQLPCLSWGSPAPRCVHGLRGVHLRPGSRRASSPNGPPLSQCSRSVPEAVCLRGFGQTHPVSLASLLRGRGLGDPAGSMRPPSFWSSWCPSVLLGPDSTALPPPPPENPLCLRQRRRQRSRSSPQYPGIQAAVQGVLTHLPLGSPFFAADVCVLWRLVIL
ncbi:hypothetical protein P4O66_017903 [Electrophorus voltai]|uniref:Uncharacterized protein n=1 Tax=Electrophorus voltai TaxID=2609070 RepID=A0AAD8YUN9_9TELE|nr:hypothetical protein P4O66_017903 [Electrophorus voltai]